MEGSRVNIEYLLSVLRRSFGFIAISYGLFITYLYVSRPVKLTPVTAVVTCSGDVVFSDDPNSSWQKPIFKDRMKDLLEVLWLYQQEDFKSYAQRYADFRRFLVSGSEAAKDASEAVLFEIGNKEGPIKTQSSSVEIDWNSFETVPGKGGGLSQVDVMRVTAKAGEEKVRHKFRLKVTFVEGEHNAAYQISKFELIDLKQSSR